MDDGTCHVLPHWMYICYQMVFSSYAAGGSLGQYKMMQKNTEKMSETLAHSSESTHHAIQ